MLSIMLCGASDTTDVADAFERVVRELGGEALWYQSGRISYINGPDSNWADNSRRTVASADLCVFVIVRRYGEITWNTELNEALAQGRPFLILALAETYQRYLTLRRDTSLDAITDPSLRNLVTTLMEVESERQLTVVPFGFDSFADVLRRECAERFADGLKALARRNERRHLALLLYEPTSLSGRELRLAEEIALDELEEKGWRKLAVSALAEKGSVSPESVAALLGSPEQGVQRLALRLLPKLHGSAPADADFMEECVAIANGSDDVGLQRRLIPALFSLDPGAAVVALLSMDLTEIGARRRIATSLEEYEAALPVQIRRGPAAELLQRCTAKSDREVGWIVRARALLARISSEEGGKPSEA